MRMIYGKYHFRILRVADFQRELEAYTGHSWEEFFKHWLYGNGMTDWASKTVEIDAADRPHAAPVPLSAVAAAPCDGAVCG